MNKIYYKGYLYNLVEKIDSNSNEFKQDMNIICNIDDNKEIGSILYHEWLYTKNTAIIENKTFIDKLNQIFKKTNYVIKNIKDNYFSKNYLIFEIIKDENNCEFAKEIFTNNIFPFINYNDINTEYLISNTKHCNHYSNSHTHRTDFTYSLNISYSCNNENILKLNNFFYSYACEIATPLEVDEYLNKKCKTKNIFGKIKDNESLKKNITNLSNNNTFKEKIIEKKEEKIEREKQDILTEYMEKIEFLLLKLDKINHIIKEEKQKKYNNLLSSYNENLTTTPLNLETLKMLEAEIEFAIKYNDKNENDILNTLDNIINEYNTNKTTNRTIKDIDELVKLFLQMKSNYSPIIQRNVIEKFALIYIYEIFENKKTITIEELKDSYINDMLKSVLICLNNMIDNNEIENNIIIKLEGDITLSYIINCIKEIKFNKNKELIKE